MTPLRKFFVTICLTACAVNAAADALSNAESEALRQEIAALMDAFESGDAMPLIESMHESAIEWGGGREVLVPAMQQAVEMIQASGIEILSAEVGEPTEIYPAGDEEICFVPRTSVFEIQGQQVRTTTFMIAIRDRANKGSWRFIEGAGLRRYPQLLETLFPDLDRNIKLPPNEVTML